MSQAVNLLDRLAALAQSSELPLPSRVLLTLLGHADETGRAWPSVAGMARRLGADERSIRRALADLRAKGLVQCVERGKGGRGTGMTRWQVAPDARPGDWRGFIVHRNPDTPGPGSEPETLTDSARVSAPNPDNPNPGIGPQTLTDGARVSGQNPDRFRSKPWQNQPGELHQELQNSPPAPPGGSEGGGSSPSEDPVERNLADQLRRRGVGTADALAEIIRRDHAIQPPELAAWLTELGPGAGPGVICLAAGDGRLAAWLAQRRHRDAERASVEALRASEAAARQIASIARVLEVVLRMPAPNAQTEARRLAECGWTPGVVEHELARAQGDPATLAASLGVEAPVAAAASDSGTGTVLPWRKHA